MIRRLILNRIKEYLEFKWELINIIVGDIVSMIVTAIFWYHLPNISNIFGISYKDAFLFLFYQWFIILLILPFYSSFRQFIPLVKSGQVSKFFLYPKNWKIYVFLSKFWIPFGPALQSIFYLSLSLKFGLSFDINFLKGILTCLFSSIVITSLLYLFFSIGIYFESEYIVQRALSWISATGNYPTHIYKGFLFIVANFILPGFLYGTFSLVVETPLFKTFLLYSIILFIISFSLGEFIVRKWVRKYESYGH